ncbi:MAG TPA: hypothetical protein VGD81_04620 [Opitutaceae bacterium]
MNLRVIIDEIADQADDFLAGAANQAEARAGISELINADYSDLPPGDRQKVADGVMNILNEEGFFENEHGAGWDDAEADDKEI